MNTWKTNQNLKEYYFRRKHTLFLITKVPGLMILKVRSFFSHGTSNSYGVLITYLGSNSFVVKNKRNYDTGRILILDVTIDDIDYILINIYNTNTYINKNVWKSRRVNWIFFVKSKVKVWNRNLFSKNRSLFHEITIYFLQSKFIC